MIIVVGARRACGESVLRALAAQTALDRFDVVVADLRADSEPPLAVPPELEARCTTVAVAGTTATVRAAAMAEASAPLVAFVEDHAYPAPGWAAAVLDAFASGAAAVGYAFEIANPDRIVPRIDGWAQMGVSLYPDGDGPQTYLTAGNVAYRTEALRGHEHLLASEFLLQQRLRQGGATLMLAAGARVAHEHFWRWRDVVAATAMAARCLACDRIQDGDWTLGKRLAAAAGVLVVAPGKRTLGLVRRIAGRPDLRRGVLRVLPGALVVFGVAALAESTGYLFPRCDHERLQHYEFDVERVKR